MNKLLFNRLLVLLLFIAGLCSFNSCVYFNIVQYTRPGIHDHKIFHNVTVASANPQPFVLHDLYNKHNIDSAALKYIQEKNTRAFIVIKDGRLLHEQYWGNFTVHNYCNSFSVAKSIVSILIGIAIDEKIIDSYDVPIKNYLGRFSNSVDTTITIRHLLEMSAGFKWGEKYSKPLGKIAASYYGKDLKKVTRKLKSTKKPGEYYEYQSVCTQLLAFILEKATNKKIHLYAAEKLWQPLGCESSALWSLDRKNGNAKVYCCFNAIARDFAKIGQLVLNKGKWNGKHIISEQNLDASFGPALYLKDEHNQNVDYYGLHWWLANYKNMKIPYARGILGQYILIIPDKNMVVVRLGETKKRKYIGAHPQEIFYYIDAAIELTK